jgi:hypothetical protein
MNTAGLSLHLFRGIAKVMILQMKVFRKAMIAEY